MSRRACAASTRARRGPRNNSACEIDSVADLLFAPTATRRRQPPPRSAATGALHITGNSGIDALMTLARDDAAPAPPARRAAPTQAARHLPPARKLGNRADLAGDGAGRAGARRRGDDRRRAPPQPAGRGDDVDAAQRRARDQPRRPARPPRDDRADARRRPHPQRFGRRPGRSPRARNPLARPARQDRAPRMRRCRAAPCSSAPTPRA